MAAVGRATSVFYNSLNNGMDMVVSDEGIIALHKNRKIFKKKLTG